MLVKGLSMAAVQGWQCLCLFQHFSKALGKQSTIMFAAPPTAAAPSASKVQKAALTSILAILCACGAACGKSPTPSTPHNDASLDMQAALRRKLANALLFCMQAGLEKASEARKKERALARFKETHSLGEGVNAELAFAVDFQLAAAYHANHLYQEALDAYTAIVKGRVVPQAGR